MQDNQENNKTTPHDNEQQRQERSRGGLGFIGKKTMSTEAKKPDTPPKAKQEKPVTFFQSHPILSINTVTPCFSSLLFNSVAFVPWLFLAVVLIAQTIFTLDTRSLWFPHEVQYASVFDSMLKSNHWFTLTLNQNTYVETPPLYFIFMRGIHILLPLQGNLLFFLTSMISGLAFLWGTLIVGRFVGRMDGRSLLAGGIILLSSVYFVGTLHHVGMELLFSTFIMLSLCGFFIALAKPCSYVFMTLAFVCAGLAYLTGGAFGLVLPVLTSLVFVIWCKKMHRLFQIDILVGLIAFLILIGAWGFGIFTEVKSFDYLLHEVLQKQFIQKGLTAFSLQNDWLFYLSWLPFIFLPWLPLLVCLPWHRIFSKNTWQAITASQKPEKEGLAFLWCIIIVSTLLLSALANKNIFYYLPAFAAISLLAGQAVLEFSLRRAAIFKIVLILLLLLLAVTTVAFAFFLFDVLESPQWLLNLLPPWKLPMFSSFYLIATLFLIIAFALWLIPRKTSVESLLLIIAIGAIAISFACFKAVAPNFDTVLSSKPQATLLNTYIDHGYYPASLDIPDEMYTYYSQADFHKLSSQAMANELIGTQKHIIIAMSASAYEEWQDKPENIEEVQRQWIVKQQYVLLAYPRNMDIEKSATKKETLQTPIEAPALIEKYPAEKPEKDLLEKEELSSPENAEADQQ